MLTTSTEVHAQSAVSTTSMGLGPLVCALSASKWMVWPTSVRPTYCVPSFHSVLAIMRGSLLTVMVVGGGLGMHQHAIYLGTFYFEAVLERRDDVVDLAHLHGVGQRAMTRDLGLVSNFRDRDLVDVDDLGQGRGGVAKVFFNG